MSSDTKCSTAHEVSLNQHSFHHVRIDSYTTHVDLTTRQIFGDGLSSICQIFLTPVKGTDGQVKMAALLSSGWQDPPLPKLFSVWCRASVLTLVTQMTAHASLTAWNVQLRESCTLAPTWPAMMRSQSMTNRMTQTVMKNERTPPTVCEQLSEKWRIALKLVLALYLHVKYFLYLHV